MRKTNREQLRQVYVPPWVEVWQGPPVGESLLSNSIGPRDDYGGGDDPITQGDINDKPGYGEGGDPLAMEIWVASRAMAKVAT